MIFVIGFLLVSVGWIIYGTSQMRDSEWMERAAGVVGGLGAGMMFVSVCTLAWRHMP
jgi:hypothetical protein